jgi:hypothetical protein
MTTGVEQGWAPTREMKAKWGIYQNWKGTTVPPKKKKKKKEKGEKGVEGYLPSS